MMTAPSPEVNVEFVLVVPRPRLFPERQPHGFEPFPAGGGEAWLDRIREHGFFMERRYAETRPEYKQIIPYAAFERGPEIFLMRRLGSGGEARLHGKLSVGVGGHINPVDGAGDVLDAGLRREIEEEVAVDGTWRAAPAGVLNDDTTAVGAVHFGLVYRVTVDGDVRVREDDALEGALTHRDAVARLLREERPRFETWSALLLDALLP